MTEHESLWERLLDHLDREGILSLQLLHSTPAEIGSQVAAKTGDSRVHRFVWGYYYPEAFGNERGSIDASAARRLVESFDKPPTPEDVIPGLDESIPTLPVTLLPPEKCGICRKRLPEEA